MARELTVAELEARYQEYLRQMLEARLDKGYQTPGQRTTKG